MARREVFPWIDTVVGNSAARNRHNTVQRLSGLQILPCQVWEEQSLLPGSARPSRRGTVPPSHLSPPEHIPDVARDLPLHLSGAGPVLWGQEEVLPNPEN